jgi:hypothetical protein
VPARARDGHDQEEGPLVITMTIPNRRHKKPDRSWLARWFTFTGGDHRTGTLAHDLIASIAKENERAFTERAESDAAAHRLAEDTMPHRFGQFLAPVEQRIDELERFGGVRVTVDTSFTPESWDCSWCMTAGQITTVRVYGDTAEDTEVYRPLGVAESCHECALGEHGPVRQARIEQDPTSRNDIRVEVSE